MKETTLPRTGLRLPIPHAFRCVFEDFQGCRIGEPFACPLASGGFHSRRPVARDDLSSGPWLAATESVGPCGTGGRVCRSLVPHGAFRAVRAPSVTTRPVRIRACPGHVGVGPAPFTPCARSAFQTRPQHSGTTRDSSDWRAWRRTTASGMPFCRSTRIS